MVAFLKRCVESPEQQETVAADVILAMITKATDIISPVWPMKNFVACNPLQGLEDLPFEQAISRAMAYSRIGATADLGKDAVNRELIKWCSAFLDEGQATLVMPNRQWGFYVTFADLARYDRHLCPNQDAITFLQKLPRTAEEAVAKCFRRLKIAPEDQEEFIRQGLTALPGWSGYVLWRTNWQEATKGMEKPITLLDYVAVRLVITCLLAPDSKILSPVTIPLPDCIGHIESSEKTYRAALMSDLVAQTERMGRPKQRPEAQLIFCIDVRSEPFRRSIEAQGAYETLGFAGFFGLPVRVKPDLEDESYASCPVLLKPCHEVCEQPTETMEGVLKHHKEGRSLLKLPKSLYSALKYNFATPFALVEMLGPLSGLLMLARTFTPSILTKANQAVRNTILPPLTTHPNLDDIPIASQANYGEGALRMMGLIDNLAPLIVLCGHGSSTVNNAYSAALDCGACGGNHGGSNARILATILNRTEIRFLLSKRGLQIPADTWFVAAEHDTTTDQVEIFVDDAANVPQDAIARLKQDLMKAADGNRQARCATFGISPGQPKHASQATEKRALDWSEVRPEWGLARNAAFIVGPREMTRNVNLWGRAFLHSYDWTKDTEGTFLQTILTAPMVVAQWINSQYLFSTLDNTVWGGGSKVTQNVAGKLGVMQGNASDLMHGLPLQSVFAADDTPYHVPQRLLVVVYAPRQWVDALISRNPILQKLFCNGWVNLMVIAPEENVSFLFQRDGTWKTLPSHPTRHE